MPSSSVTGPSSSATPYLVGLEPNVRFASIITTGDTVTGAAPLPDGGAWRFGGIPDGIGAYDNGDGTITILVNHEIFVDATTATIERAHGAPGAYVSAVVTDKTTLQVVDAYDLARVMYTDVDGDGVWLLEADNLDRLCSADLPAVEAFFWAGADGIAGTADDMGTRARIYMNGEEFGPEGRAWGWVATGPDARSVWELSALGNFSWENSVASTNSGAKTVVVGTDDATPGQVYVYIGDKQNTGNTIEKAGLNNGKLYGIKADGIGNDATSENIVGAVPTSGSFDLIELPGARTMTGADLNTLSDSLGVSEFARPEDAAWDTINPNRLYFATTGAGAAPNRLWAFTFDDISNPELGGTFELMLDGTEGTVTLDNITVAADGKVWMVEDPGNNARNALTWVYDPVTDTVDVVAYHDVARFGGVGIPATPPFNVNEEASGIIDVTDLLGNADTQAFLVDVQAHFAQASVRDRAELVEGGQLLVMYVDDVKNGTRGDDLLNGSYTDDNLSGAIGNDTIYGGSGDDTLRGGLGDDLLVGGKGADVLYGGAGADMFLYNNPDEGGDTIVNFARGQSDKIVISAEDFGITEISFVRGMTATAATGQFLYDAVNTTLWFDADGTGAGAATMIADFSNAHLGLRATDLVLV
jgi:Ca2+-binding RTX toxin-like protein